jgi:hypothetical protein
MQAYFAKLGFAPEIRFIIAVLLEPFTESE